MAHGDLKDLSRRTASNKVFHGKAVNIGKNLKYQCGLASMRYKCFGKKFAIHKEIEINSGNQKLADELHKLNIRKLKHRKYSFSKTTFGVLIFSILN